MKPSLCLKIGGLLAILLACLEPAVTALPAGAIGTGGSARLSPVSYKTTRGSDGGEPVANLAVMNQTGTDDQPSAYVTFLTLGTPYQGHRSYYLPAAVLRTSVSSMQIKVNFKGPAKSTQAWSWYAYDWSTSGWAWIGSNAAARSGVWSLLTFTPTSPRRFISKSTGEMRIQMRSGDSGKNAKLDYETVTLGYALTPTPTVSTTPTATSAPTGTLAPTVSPSPTSSPGGAPVPTLAGCSIYPADSIWNTRVDTLPVDPRSSQWISSIGASRSLHMDFGSGTWDGGPIGIPYNLVPAGQPKLPVSFYYPDESDAGPYPIPSSPLIEWGSDHHILIVDRDNCLLYELFDASKSGGAWSAGSGAIWDLSSNALRPDSWTSADAAGLPILPGLVRYDEVFDGEINHAIRFTAHCSRGYIWPGRHDATSGTCSNPPPLGVRFRLKASFGISGYPAQMQVILRAMQKYGIILADNGSDWFISGVPDERWDNDMLHTLDNITGSNFEAVDESGLMVNPDSGQAAP